MSNSRSFRRGLKGARQASPKRGLATTSAPSLGTTRRWLKAAEAEGGVRRAEDRRTGKPGRPAHMWEITEEGRERAKGLPPLEIMMEQVRRRENRRRKRQDAT
jgi:DNA-binding PadR family transcriptional regulator